ncbi:MAG: fasciclin domain-containing protein, partial [Gemmatimonadota bacterium]
MDTRIWAVRGRAAMGLAVALLLGVSVAACDDDDDEPTGPSSTIVDLASSSPNLQTLTAAILAAGLDDELSAPGSYTVFAPTDAAFGVLGEESVQALLADENADVLEELLLGHAVAGTYASSDLSDGQILTTLSGDELEVTVSNGVARVGGVAVETADLEATNGVVHVVGGVLTGGLDAVQLARIVPDLSTLVTAVTAAELEGTLSSDGPFTVFAPVNSAFADLDSEALGRLLAAGNQELLQQVLTYHVVAGEIMAADLEDGAEVATVEGSTLEIGLGDGATVNGANIIATDIRVENGVIHLIDEVLLQNLDIVDVAILNGFDSLVGAVQAAG